MSDLLQSPAPESPKEAKARAKAEKAYGKAVRPWYKKPLIAIPLGIVALMVIASMSGGGDTTTPAPVSDVSAADAPGDAAVAADVEDATVEDAAVEEAPVVEEAASLPGIGDAVKDGKFTFVVNSFDCGKRAVGSSFMREKAQGQFCLMDVTVKNHGDEAQFLFSDNQLVFDAKGRQFSHDDQAAMSIEGNDSIWIEEINPGNSVQGTMVWDVPKNAKIVSAELHDSAFSGGVEISLK